VGKSLEERQQIVNGAFIAKESLVTGKRGLLVDDVLTTGSALDAVAAGFKQAGAVDVSAVVVSQAE
jgi:predicted amidophosphoribosyltransferase